MVRYNTEQRDLKSALLLWTRRLINAILFDIKDFVGDKLNGTRSLPVVFGLQKTKYIAAGLSLILLPLCILDNKLFGFSLIALSYLILNAKSEMPNKALLDFILLFALAGFI